jgi:Trk K+ transport system NAD-binding subunit
MALTGAFFVTQIIPALIMAKLFGWKRAFSSGILLTSRLGLSIATAQIGLGLGLISSDTNAGIVIASILTCILSPLFYKVLSAREEHFYNVYIVGGGQTGLELAKRLSLHRVPYIVIESQMDQQEVLESLHINFLNANDLDLKVYEELKIRPTDTVVIVTQSDKKNIKISKMIRKKLNHNKVITVTTKPELYLDRDLSDIKVVNAHDVTASNIENEIMRPGTMEALTGSFGNYSIEEIAVRNKEVVRKFVREVPFPLAGSLVAIRRDNEILIPHGDTHILEGDLITVIGNAAAMEEYRRLLE